MGSRRTFPLPNSEHKSQTASVRRPGGQKVVKVAKVANFSPHRPHLATLKYRLFEPKLSKVAKVANIASVFPTPLAALPAVLLMTGTDVGLGWAVSPMRFWTCCLHVPIS